MAAIKHCSLLLLACCVMVASIVPGRIIEDENIGVGTAEEVPISSFTLTFAEPDVKVHRALPPPQTVFLAQTQQPSDFSTREVQDYELYDELEDEYMDDEQPGPVPSVPGKGSIEAIPIESMRVRFEPVQRLEAEDAPREESIAGESSMECVESCSLPSMPPAMAAAAQHCNVELVFHRPDSPLPFNNRNRTANKPYREPRRLDTSLRTACGSKCVLSMLHFLDEEGVPDGLALTQFLLEHAGADWETALHAANNECLKPSVLTPPGKYEFEDREKCLMAASFMRCIRMQMVQYCPPDKIKKECFTKDTMPLSEESRR